MEHRKVFAVSIDRIVKSYALSISARPENMALTLTQIKRKLYATDDGRCVRELRDAVMANKGVAVNTGLGEFVDGFLVLTYWAGLVCSGKKPERAVTMAQVDTEWWEVEMF